MHDGSREFDRGFCAGQYLAFTAPRERLRMLGAHESVFAANPPQALLPALAAYRQRNYAACEKAAQSLMDAGTLYGLELQQAEQLRDAARLIQQSVAHDLVRAKGLITEGKLYEASLDLAQLKAVMPDGDAGLAAIEQALSAPEAKNALAEDKKRYQSYINSLPPQLVPRDEVGETGPEWKVLVSREDLSQKSETSKASVWRMKVLESLATAPKGWTENTFDDSSWTTTTMPISWHLNHTALFRAPFEIADKNAVKSLRLRQWAFRQEDLQVFINGALVAKITPSGSGGKEIEVPLNDHALKLLKNGHNTLAATYKNTWRWGRYFAKSESLGRNSVYNSGVHLILEMQAQD